MKHDVFISYSRKDRTFVLDFAEKLKSVGFSVWVDYEGIHSSEDFKRRIVESINDSECFLFFSSDDSNKSQYTVKEVGVAVQLKKHIIPIKLDEAPYAHSILFDLVNIDYVDATQHEMDYVFKKVTDVLTLYCGKRADVNFFDIHFANRIDKKKSRRLYLNVSLLAFVLLLVAIVFFNFYDNNIVESFSDADSVILSSSENEEVKSGDTQSFSQPSLSRTDETKKVNHQEATEPNYGVEKYNDLVSRFRSLLRFHEPSTSELLEAQGIASQIDVIEKKNYGNPDFNKTVELRFRLDRQLEMKSDDYVRYAYDNLRANNDSAAEEACKLAGKLKYSEKVHQLEKEIEQRKKH